MARSDSMAKIDKALQSGPIEDANYPAATHPYDPLGVVPGAPEPTKESDPYLDEKGEEGEEGEEKSERQKLIDDAFEKKKAKEEFNKNHAAAASAINTVKTARGIVKDTGVQIEKIPTPGSLALPLIVLAIFFFLLIPVNGHTRFMWIWLVVTGNAEIATPTAGGPTSTSDGVVSESTGPSTATIDQLAGATKQPQFASSVGTFAEDV